VPNGAYPFGVELESVVRILTTLPPGTVVGYHASGPTERIWVTAQMLLDRLSAYRRKGLPVWAEEPYPYTIQLSAAEGTFKLLAVPEESPLFQTLREADPASRR
jgi:hypothetical protein